MKRKTFFLHEVQERRNKLLGARYYPVRDKAKARNLLKNQIERQFRERNKDDAVDEY